MRAWRWDLIVAAAILAVAIALYGATHRYSYMRDGMVLDRITGKVCRPIMSGSGQRCWERGSTGD